MNLKVPGAILPLGCAILSTRAKTVRGLIQLPLGELGLKTQAGTVCLITYLRVLGITDKELQEIKKCIRLFFFSLCKLCKLVHLHD